MSKVHHIHMIIQNTVTRSQAVARIANCTASWQTISDCC